MGRRVITTIATVLAVGGVVWFASEALGGGPAEPTKVSEARPEGRSEALARARLSGDLAVLDAFVAEQRRMCDTATDDPAAWRVLAEAHLERCLLRDTRKGMTVGQPTHAELPKPNVDDIEAGVAAADRAVELGDPTADVHRIRSALISLRVTGFASALSTRAAVNEALSRAEAIDPQHPRVVIARACEKLFAPNVLMGHDPATARRMFLLAADALPLDERPFVFAAMCAWLLEESDDAIALLEKATARNPNSAYAAEVLRRLRAGENEPFGRDV